MPGLVVLPFVDEQIVDVLVFTHRRFGARKAQDYRGLIGDAFAALEEAHSEVRQPLSSMTPQTPFWQHWEFGTPEIGQFLLVSAGVPAAAFRY